MIRLRDGERWLAAVPAWSTLSAVGWFSLAKAGHRFDRHFHDCAEYWAITEGRARVAVGGEAFDVGPGDLVCTPAGVEHDLVRAYTDDVVLLFIEEPVPPGGTAGHRHHDPGTAWHDVPRGPLDYDAEVRLHDEHFRRVCDVQPWQHVLDIGCGIGQTTCEAARMARQGSALGLDISASAVERARELAKAHGIGNVGFECADAQVHRFPPERFDLAVSRFGTMFFGDPVAAFANIRRALRPGGRLVMMVWQAAERNEWAVAIRRSLAVPEEPSGPDPFSLADPAVVRTILNDGGFAGITLTDVDEPVYYGPDVAAALDWVRGFRSTREVLSRLDPAGAARVLERLRKTLAAHLSDDGVWFGSRAWIVSAS